MIDEPDDDLDWQNYTLKQKHPVFDHKLLLEELCIPINLTNTHWILIHLDLKNNTCFPINPYHPQNPSIDEIQTAGEIALKILQQYGLQEPELRSPYYCHCLPVQHPSDSINCGVYVCLYMVIYAFGSFSKK